LYLFPHISLRHSALLPFEPFRGHVY
jgi:hypothetical protein